MDFGWFQDDDDGLSQLNITPLVDVSLVLLILFMITAPMLVQGANVNLPQTRPISKLPSGNIFLSVTAEGDVFLNDATEPIDVGDIEHRIFPLVQLGQAVYLRGDKAVSYGRIAEVMDAIKAAGAEVNLVFEIKPPSAR